MPSNKEQHFEDEVVASLVEDGGWTLGHSSDVDLATGIASPQLVEFLARTQPKEWEKLRAQFAGPDEAQLAFRKRVAAEVDSRGTVDVLRHGVKMNGCAFRLCWFKPAHGLTPELEHAYASNVLTVTRQQRYSAKHTNSTLR